MIDRSKGISSHPSLDINALQLVVGLLLSCCASAPPTSQHRRGLNEINYIFTKWSPCALTLERVVSGKSKGGINLFLKKELAQNLLDEPMNVTFFAAISHPSSASEQMTLSSTS
mmetsp:Transcript_36135/g.76110  ORF Transcript_36135/g.76110 Transcript_36135/m.76110 type:complete len:114 (+) Transcript_36135:309-650(+)